MNDGAYGSVDSKKGFVWGHYMRWTNAVLQSDDLNKKIDVLSSFASRSDQPATDIKIPI